METVEAVGGQKCLARFFVSDNDLPHPVGCGPKRCLGIKMLSRSGPCPWTLKRPEGSETCLKRRPSVHLEAIRARLPLTDGSSEGRYFASSAATPL